VKRPGAKTFFWPNAKNGFCGILRLSGCIIVFGLYAQKCKKWGHRLYRGFLGAPSLRSGVISARCRCSGSLRLPRLAGEIAPRIRHWTLDFGLSCPPPAHHHPWS
jgi:hypothetical protein